MTRGEPGAVSGGHLFHHRMAEAAGQHGAQFERVRVRALRYPLARNGSAAPDVVLVDSLVAAKVAPWIAVRKPARLAAIVHQRPGGVDHGALRNRVQCGLDLFVYRRCDLLIAVSEAVADELAEHGLPRDRIVVVSPGSDLPDSAPRSGMRDGRALAVLCVANWHRNKGIVELLEAVAALAPGDVTLHLAGTTDVDPVYGAEVRARIARPDLVGRCVVHGRVEPARLAGLYCGADVFAMASRVEAFGTVYAEALRAGLPLVGWRSGNLPNLVTDGVEGCLVAPGDVAGLARCLARLAAEPQWRSRLAEGARRKGATLASWDATASAFYGALSRVAASPG